jgi:hypothetical protein
MAKKVIITTARKEFTDKLLLYVFGFMAVWVMIGAIVKPLLIVGGIVLMFMDFWLFLISALIGAVVFFVFGPAHALSASLIIYCIFYPDRHSRKKNG